MPLEATGPLTKYPARASFIWYLGLIAVGGLILAQPVCRTPRTEPISALDAVFTSTSAACVTGLSVRSTQRDFSFLGQLVILLLIQLGGIGIMTVTTFVMLQWGRRESLHSRTLMTQTLGADDRTDLRGILRNVLRITLVCEAGGFVILTIRGLFEHPPGTAVWHALFHSVSAFCNAGFALHDDSLVRYQSDVVVNLTIGALVIVGGLGYPVLLDISRVWKGRTWFERWDQLYLHTKLMIVGTAVLLVLGTVSFLVLEWDGVLLDMPLWKRPMVAMFHSMSCRTAGFNTVDVSSLTNATLFITVVLMAIGAGPCSTAGGFKVSTLAVLVLQAWSAFHGKLRITVFRRSISAGSVQRATTTSVCFWSWRLSR